MSNPPSSQEDIIYSSLGYSKIILEPFEGENKTKPLILREFNNINAVNKKPLSMLIRFNAHKFLICMLVHRKIDFEI